MSRIVIVIIGLLLVIGGLFLGLTGKFQDLFGKKQPEQITLTYWGTQEEQSVLQPVFDAYHKDHPNVTITYVKQSTINYRTRVQTQLRAGQGPDLFDIHNSWLPMFTSDLLPAPDKTLSVAQFNKTYYPVATETLVSNKKVYAVPQELDGLVLFYNEELLKFANVNPPTTWPDLISGALKIKVEPEKSPIQTAGIAMGSLDNVDFWPEIIGMLFYQQPEGDVTRPNNKDGQEVLAFFGGFTLDKSKKTWDGILPSSTQMFVNGKLAYYLAPSKMARQISQLNPNLKYKTIPVPQLPGKQVSWGTFWATGVSARSKHQQEAWNFMMYLSSQDGLHMINQQRVQSGQLPKVYPRQDMADQQLNDPILGSVVKFGSSFKSWYLNSDTSDDGLNDEMIKVYDQGVRTYLQKGSSTDSVLEDIEAGISEVLAKYIPTKKASK